MRTARARQKAAVLASLCCLVGALPFAPAPELLGSLPSLGRGELLCQAYGVYRILMPESMISFEHAVFLLTALVRGDELVLSACRECNAVLIIDRWSLRAPRCALCASESLTVADLSGALGAGVYGSGGETGTATAAQGAAAARASPPLPRG